MLLLRHDLGLHRSSGFRNSSVPNFHHINWHFGMLTYFAGKSVNMPSYEAQRKRRLRAKYREELLHVESEIAKYSSKNGYETVVIAFRAKRNTLLKKLGRAEVPIEEETEVVVESGPPPLDSAQQSASMNSSFVTVPDETGLDEENNRTIDTTADSAQDGDATEEGLQIENTPGNVLVFKKTVTDFCIWAMMLAILAKHKISRHCLIDIFRMLNTLFVSKKPVFPQHWDSLKRALTKLIPVKSQWVVYCSTCEEIVFKGLLKRVPRQATCPACGANLKKDLEEGKGLMVSIPMKDQIKSYLDAGHLRILINDLKNSSEDQNHGELHRRAMADNKVPIRIGSDGAPLTKWPQKSIYPIVAFFSDLPPPYQRRFPILIAVYCGQTKNKPHPLILYKLLKQDLESVNGAGLTWVDGSRLDLEVTMVNADNPEMALVLQQRTSGYYSCPTCLIKGEQLEEEENTTVRFTELVHEHPSQLRTRHHRLLCAEKINDHEEETGEIQEIAGVQGYPLLHSLPYFDETFSYCPDLLHVALLGLGRIIISTLCKASGGLSNFRRRGQATFGGKNLEWLCANDNVYHVPKLFIN